MIGILSFCAGCGSSGSDAKNGAANEAQSGGNPVAWESIPSSFNPRVEEKIFKIDRLEKVEMDFFDFSGDVSVSYSNQLAADEAQLKTYTVFKNSASFGSLDIGRSEKKASLKRYGEYKCSIRIKNGQITELDGGCFVRIELILPMNIEIEVYNLQTLLTKRFFAVDNVTFLLNLKNATWEEDKLAVIEDYLASYVAVKKTPVLNSAELKMALERFSRSENHFTVLQKLHGFVKDRDQLKAVIDRVFTYFDREKAYKICGV